MRDLSEIYGLVRMSEYAIEYIAYLVPFFFLDRWFNLRTNLICLNHMGIDLENRIRIKIGIAINF